MPLYRIIEQPSGFCVERLSRDRVSVQLEPWALWLTQEGQPAERCTFYDGDRLPVLIAMKLVGEDHAAFDETDPPGLSRAVREARTIRTDVGLQRLRLLAQVDPAVHQIQLIALRIAGRVPSLAQEAALFREPYILKDILTHRAAAIAFAYLQSGLWRPPIRVEEGSEVQEDRDMEVSEAPVEELLGAMADWRGLFSPDGRPYRSLNLWPDSVHPVAGNREGVPAHLLSGPSVGAAASHRFNPKNFLHRVFYPALTQAGIVNFRWHVYATASRAAWLWPA
jgi:hypothetical protein